MSFLAIALVLTTGAIAENVATTCWCQCDDGKESSFTSVSQCGPSGSSECTNGCKMRCDPDNKDKKFQTTCSQGFDCTKYANVVSMSTCVIGDTEKCFKDPKNMNLKGNALACACNSVYYSCATSNSCTVQAGVRDACLALCMANQCAATSTSGPPAALALALVPAQVTYVIAIIVVAHFI